MEHFYEQLGGWGTYEEQGELIKCILSNYSTNNKLNIAEIGVYLGRTTSIWNIELINSGFKYEYFAIDNFKGSTEHINSGIIPNYELCVKNLEPVKNYINLIKADSIEASQMYQDYFFDIVYIDASHDYDSVKKDIELWYPKVKPGGFICGDDYIIGWQGVVKAVDEFFSSGVKKIGNQQWLVKK